MPNDSDVISHIKEKFGYAKEFGAKRIDLSIDELVYLLQHLEWWEQAAETQKDNNLKLLQQIEQQQAEIERWKRDGDWLREELGVTLKRWDESDKNLQQSRERLLEELEILKLNLETQVRHFNDTTEELEKAYEECDAIEAERDDYRKVLESISLGISKMNGYIVPPHEVARDILSRYTEKGEYTE